MPCLSKTSRSSSLKSPPTTPTILTFVKKLAEIEKWDAEPPSIFSHLPNGVSTASKATEPTTRRDILLIESPERIERASLTNLKRCAFCLLPYCLLTGGFAPPSARKSSSASLLKGLLG